MKTIRLCPGCGAPLPPDAPAGLCPQCLLKSDAPTLNIGATDARPAARPIPVPGQMFGDYRILRLLGQGGMGEVFEAEHSETGRRVALKVMSHALASEQDRKRFLREGRLAASVNHPNVVYIHGSEEIDGVPVITMELVHGGTLKERLKREGPARSPWPTRSRRPCISSLASKRRTARACFIATSNPPTVSSPPTAP